MSNARSIYQDMLDTMSRALLARDSRTWCAHIMTPHLVATLDGRAIQETTEQVVTGMQSFADSLDTMGVTEITRTCETARMIDPTTIVGYHTNHLVRCDGTALPTYEGKWVLQQLAGAWRISKSENALSLQDAGWTMLPHASVHGFKGRAVDGATARKAEAQLIMDRLDTIFVSGDLDGWLRAVSLPLTIEATNAVQVLRTEAELVEDFHLYRNQFEIHRVTDVTRQVMAADLIEEDEMMCHFRVHVLSSGTYVVPPWDAAAILLRVDGMWRVSRIRRALGHTNWISTRQDHHT